MVTIEKIRERCGYSSVNGIREVWQKHVHPEVAFPNKYEELASELCLPLLEYLATPKNGKSQIPINAAKEMLVELGFWTEKKGKVEGETHGNAGSLSNEKQGGAERNKEVIDTKRPKENAPKSKPIMQDRQRKEKEKWPVWMVETFGDFAPVDLVTYLSICLFGVSTVGIFGWVIGPFFWGVFTTVILNALRIVKTRKLRDAAWTAITFVVIVESVAGMLEYSFIYMTLKEKVPDLPWGTKDQVYDTVALASSALIAFVSIFAMYMRYQMTQAIINSVDFTRAHGEEY